MRVAVKNSEFSPRRISALKLAEPASWLWLCTWSFTICWATRTTIALADRLLDDSSQNLSRWLRVVDREVDVRGLADLDDCRQASFIGVALSRGN